MHPTCQQQGGEECGTMIWITEAKKKEVKLPQKLLWAETTLGNSNESREAHHKSYVEIMQINPSVS